jgi:putative MATE family efflux protein
MTEVGAAELPALVAPLRGVPPQPLLDRPIMRTLVTLAAPNAAALTLQVCVAIAETGYIGRLGTEPLAAMALVFPFVILTMTMSGGAMGGGVAAAVARALGAGDTARAAALALHALLIGLLFGLLFTAGMLLFGPALLEMLGGRGRVLAEARGYVEIFFAGAVLPWLMNTLNSLLRGTGNMRLPSVLMLVSAAIQIGLGGSLALGLGPIPSFGMRGVACGALVAFATSSAVSLAYLLAGRGPIRLREAPLRLHREMFVDILRVGAVACFSPLQSVLAITVFTHMLARFGTEVLAGYGIGARLEYVLTSIGFGIGIAAVPMVGMAIGAGRIDRARRVAWCGGALAFGLMLLAGALFALQPWLWVHLFTDDAAVRAAGYRYLAIAAPANAFLGLGIVLYFAAQGAARINGPVLAQTGRLVTIAAGGAVLAALDAPAAAYYALAAFSMAVMGLGCVAALWLTPWDRAVTARRGPPS